MPLHMARPSLLPPTWIGASIGAICMCDSRSARGHGFTVRLLERGGGNFAAAGAGDAVCGERGVSVRASVRGARQRASTASWRSLSCERGAGPAVRRDGVLRSRAVWSWRVERSE